MKAVIWAAYGPPDVLELRDVEKPAPKDDEVLIRVRATTATLGDCEMRSMTVLGWARLPLRMYFGFSAPRRATIPGQELAGEVEAIGRAVTRFKAGDPVFAPTLFRFGAYAEYACLPETYPVRKPDRLSFEEAATIPTGGVNAAHALRAADVRAGCALLINGAGGSIGTYAVQIAKALGAEVTAVDGADKLAMLRAIGADHVIDYAREDFTRRGQAYDVIFDVVGKSAFSPSVRALRPGGRYVLGNPSLSAMLRGRWTTMTSDKRVIFDQADNMPEDYATVLQLIEAGRVKPVIDRCFPLDQIVEAHRYVESGRKQGNVVIQT